MQLLRGLLVLMNVRLALAARVRGDRPPQFTRGTEIASAGFLCAPTTREKRSMRITTITLAAALAVAMVGSAFAQGAPGGNGSGGNVGGGSTTESSASEPGNKPGK